MGTIQWPDESLGLASSGQQETLTVNALGQTVTMSDRNGNVHTLTYDVLGRVVSDAVTTLGGTTDGAVRRIETAYDAQGNAYLVTSYNAASGGSVVNQVQRAFNGLGQLITEWQSHSGSVNTSTSPKVQYTWSEMPSGANHSRLTSIVYPNGRTISYDYGTSSALNDLISRLNAIKDGSTTLEGYSYLGAETVVVRSHPQPGVDLTYVKRSGESNADAGDQYIGLDRFGRVADQRWAVASSGTARDRFQYTYDTASNRTARTNVVNTSFNESYTYDSLDQLASFTRGSHTLAWDYDAVGNFDSVTTDGGSPQTRSANRQNEITSISGATTPTYDGNGNMTGDEVGHTLVYDAWNRLVQVKSGSTVLVSYQYDGTNRRVVRNDGTARDLYYSADWQVVEERVSGNADMQYVWSPVYVDAMIARDRDTDANGSLDERLYAIQDGNWNVTALLDTAGNVVERYAYDPYGVVSVYNVSWSSLASSAYSWSSGFQGMFFDATAGLSHQRERWYSPTLGRWVTMDPTHYDAGDMVLYRAMGNNPVTTIDPSGLVWIPTGGRMIAPVTQGPRYSIVSGYIHHLSGKPVIPYDRPSRYGRYVDYTVAPPPPHPLAPMFRWVADYDHNELIRREFINPPPIVYYTEEVWVDFPVPVLVPVRVPVPAPVNSPLPITITQPNPAKPGFWDMPEDPLYDFGRGFACGILIGVTVYFAWPVVAAAATWEVATVTAAAILGTATFGNSASAQSPAGGSPGGGSGGGSTNSGNRPHQSEDILILGGGRLETVPK